MKNTRLLIFVLNIAISFGCTTNEKENRDEIVASFEGGNISMVELDNSIKNQLYEQLYGVYYIRNLALEELIAQKVLSAQALEKNVTKETLLKQEVYNRLSTKGLLEFCKKYDMMINVQDPQNPFKSIKTESKEGQKLVWDAYKKKQVENYCTILFEKYKVNRFLSPPLTPKIALDSVHYVSEGKRNAKINIWIMSDFSCESCKMYYPILEKTFDKYKDKVEFRYSPLTDIVNESSIACECATRQGEFHSIYNYIFENGNMDTLSLLSFMRNKNMDLIKYQNCLKDPKVEDFLVENLNQIKKLGIVNTPSVFVNNRLYYGQLTESKFFQYIDMVLAKH